MRLIFTCFMLVFAATTAAALTSQDGSNAKPAVPKSATPDAVVTEEKAEDADPKSKPGGIFPRDVRVAFLKSCVGFHKEMLDPCVCMLKQFQRNLSFNEFVSLSEQEDPRQDSRFIQIANHCGSGNY